MSSVMLDTTGNRIATALENIAVAKGGRITPLMNSELAIGTAIEAIGIPAYVEDVSTYSDYGLTDTGWYIFARITSETGEKVTSATTITGAAGSIATIGNDYVDIAVKFEVAAQSKTVSIRWDSYTDTFIFKATDLAIRNLDYRTTFYVYDVDNFVIWSYAPTTDATFTADHHYYTEANGVYTEVTDFVAGGAIHAPYYMDGHTLTADETFQEGKTYYTKAGTAYTSATILAIGAAVPASTYYEHSYALTEDATFVEGKTYYTENNGEYTAATVTTGEAVSENTYYVDAYTLTADETFQEGKIYYTASNNVYSEVVLIEGHSIPASTYYEGTWDLATNTHYVSGTTYYTVSSGVYTAVNLLFAGEAVPENTYYEHSYALTEDETFVEGKTYYTLADDVYTAATVTAGESVAADTYYVDAYTATSDETFSAEKTYYALNETVYTPFTVVSTSDDVPTVYYNHSKVTFSGMARNITYKLDTIVDCPMEFILPEIEDETHGCWFEIRCQHAGEYSMTLVPPSDDVKIATEHTQKETAGINTIDLHYNYINGLKIWRFMNTHSSIPTAAATTT